MSALAVDVRARLTTPQARKFIRYSMVSVIAVVTTLGVQAIALTLFDIDGTESAIIASTIAAVPSYFLNRSWVWGKSGRSHVMKEVVPFWVMAAIGLAFSTAASTIADHLIQEATDNETIRTLVILTTTFTTFGVLWIAKFVIFNKILFANREDELDPALDGRTGLPT